jgi:hypothetical protein
MLIIPVRGSSPQGQEAPLIYYCKEIVHLLPKILHKCTPYSIPSTAERTHCWVLSEMCCRGICLLSLSPSRARTHTHTHTHTLSLSLCVPMVVNAVREVRELWTERSKCLSHQAHWIWQLLLLVLQPSQCSLHGPWGKGGLLVLGGYLKILITINSSLWASERGEWLVRGSWKYIKIKEPLGSSYFKKPPYSGSHEGTCSFKAVNWLFAIFSGGGNHGYEPPWYPVRDWCGF